MKNILLFLVLIAIFFGGCESDRRYDVIKRSRECVKSKIATPSTAVFTMDSKIQAQQQNDSSYQILSNFDAQNKYGAIIRSGFVSNVTYHKDGTVEVECGIIDYNP